MGRHHLRNFHDDSRVQVVAVCDLDQAKRSEVADEFGIATCAEPADILQMDLDAVAIAVPNVYHHDLTLAAIDRGLHDFCEKPMAMTVSEAEAMRDAAESANRRLMINFSFRFSPMSFALKQQVDSGVIGDIYFGRTVWHRRRRR